MYAGRQAGKQTGRQAGRQVGLQGNMIRGTGTWQRGKVPGTAIAPLLQVRPEGLQVARQPHARVTSQRRCAAEGPVRMEGKPTQTASQKEGSG